MASRFFFILALAAHAASPAQAQERDAASGEWRMEPVASAPAAAALPPPATLTDAPPPPPPPMLTRRHLRMDTSLGGFDTVTPPPPPTPEVAGETPQPAPPLTPPGDSPDDSRPRPPDSQNARAHAGD